MRPPLYRESIWKEAAETLRARLGVGTGFCFAVLCLILWVDFRIEDPEEKPPAGYERISALSPTAAPEEPVSTYEDDFAEILDLPPEEGDEEMGRDFTRPIAYEDDPLEEDEEAAEIAKRKSKASKKSKWQSLLLVELLAAAAEHAQNTDAPIDYLIRIASMQDRVRDRDGARTSLDWAAENAFEMAEVTEISENLARVSAAQARYGSIAQAEALSEYIPLAEDKAKALSELSKNQARKRAITAAKETALGITVARRRSDALIWIAMQQAVLKDFEGAMATAREVSGNMSSLALERVAIGMARARGTEAARRAVNLISDPDAKADALAEVAGMNARMGNVAAANRLGWMIPSYFAQEKAQAWARISEAHVRNRNYSEAVLTANLIDVPAMREATLENVAIHQSRAGDFGGTYSTIGNMRDEAIRNHSLKRLAQAQAVFFDAYGARKSVAEIRDPLEKENALATVAKTQVRIGDFASAERTAELIILADRRSSTLADIAKFQARAGEFNGANVNLIEAYSVALTVPNIKQRSQLMVEIASAHAEASQIDSAFNIAAGIEDAKMRAKALDAVARSQALAGDVPGALITATNIEHQRTRELTMLGIASTVGEEIPVDQARTTLDQFEIPEQKVRFILTFAQRLLPKKTRSPIGFAPDANREFWRKLIGQTG